MNTTTIDAEFDPKMKIYLILQVAAMLTATVVGILGLPFWAVLGPIWAGVYFPTIQARLTDRALVYSHGVLFRQEMSIPLDKIQDVSLLHGPLLDAFGLCTLKVETAGGGQQGSAAVLVGVRNAPSFRAAVIGRRDALAETHAPDSSDEIALLREIREVLIRIEQRLPSGTRS